MDPEQSMNIARAENAVDAGDDWRGTWELLGCCKWCGEMLAQLESKSSINGVSGRAMNSR